MRERERECVCVCVCVTDRQTAQCDNARTRIDRRKRANVEALGDRLSRAVHKTQTKQERDGIEVLLEETAKDVLESSAVGIQ